MANPKHQAVLEQGADVWNRWRTENPEVLPDFSGSHLERRDLRGANLSRADLRHADLRHADLMEANLAQADLTEAILSTANLKNAKLTDAILYRADLRIADLSGAKLFRANLRKAKLRSAMLTEASFLEADLREAQLAEAILIRAVLRKAKLKESNLCSTECASADFSYADATRMRLDNADLTGAMAVGANLVKADLSEANLSKADFSEADLTGARLERAIMTETKFERANLKGCSVYGVSAWGLRLTDAKQSDLVITPRGDSVITVDNLEVAQFVYLLLNNAKLRDLIETVTAKVVLILGRFTPNRKTILNAIRDEVRRLGYSPVLFDFQKPSTRNLTETVSALAHLARFVIADITDARSIPQELMAIVPNLPSVPVQPLLLASQQEYGMFEHFRSYPWVLPPYLYLNEASLLAALGECVIAPAEARLKSNAQEKG